MPIGSRRFSPGGSPVSTRLQQTCGNLKIFWQQISPPRACARPESAAFADRNLAAGAGGRRHVEEDFLRIPRTAAERMAKAIPFPGVADSTEFHRNHLSFGSAYFQHGYYGQAEASFRLALRENPTSAEACCGLGSSYLEMLKPRDARTSFERALQLQPSYPDPWRMRAVLRPSRPLQDRATPGTRSGLTL
jgi:Tfp pilus assembly protein PilF